jgi:phospholipid N-methyltransferase
MTMNPAARVSLSFLQRRGQAAARVSDLAEHNRTTVAATHAAAAPTFARLAGETAPTHVAQVDQLFPTPPTLAARMASLIPETARRILDPQAGTGRLLDALADLGRPFETVAVEVSRELSPHLFNKYPSARLFVRDFLSCSVEDLGGSFDCVLMNPPFRRGLDVQHILHARRFLKPRGLLISLCYGGTAQNRDLRPIAASWEVLPSGSFKSEGTTAEAVLLTLAG